MANPSKRYPWVLESYLPYLGKWFDLAAYRTESEAHGHMAAIRRDEQSRGEERPLELRITNFNDPKERQQP